MTVQQENIIVKSRIGAIEIVIITSRALQEATTQTVDKGENVDPDSGSQLYEELKQKVSCPEIC